jgi:hypothetical protein
MGNTAGFLYFRGIELPQFTLDSWDRENPGKKIQNVKNIHSMMRNRLIIFGVMFVLALSIGACTSFKKPAMMNEAPVYERALTEEDNRIRVSAAVVGDQEALQIFGIDLSRKKIQAVWIDVENNTGSPLVLLPTAIDPEYYAPLEVAFAYHKAFAKEANAALNEHLLNLNFPIRSAVAPGSHASGYIFTARKKGMKVIDVDLLGNDFSQNFTFFASNPDSTLGQNIINYLDSMYSSAMLQKVGSVAKLREALEQLPCCVSNEIDGLSSAEPLNVVIIGAIEDWTTAFVRRGYHYQVLSPRYAFGRAQDISGKKQSRGYTAAQAHTFRLWQTPIRYQGKSVWVGQTSVRRGGRFAEKAPLEVTLPVDPDVDEARLDLVQDLVYSQALIKIGFIKGSGQSQSPPAEKLSADVYYTTDGLRAVLVFGDRPTSLEEIDFFNWEHFVDYR